ncbi:amidohydrolase family protein [Sphingomonas sp. MMS24-JH45]
MPGAIGARLPRGRAQPGAQGDFDAAARFQRLDDELFAILTQPHRGSVMVTLAPERVEPERIAALVAVGVRVSAGHSEASHAEALAAFDAGMSGVTHLFNAMPPMLQRAPGLVGAALDDPRPWCGLIVDGVHVDPAVLRVAVAARPADRMMLVTDAMPSVGAREKDFVLQRRRIRVADGICAYEDGTLAGADLDMAGAVRRAVELLRVDPSRAAAMAATHPAAFLGRNNERGRIAAGLRASIRLAGPGASAGRDMDRRRPRRRLRIVARTRNSRSTFPLPRINEAATSGGSSGEHHDRPRRPRRRPRTRRLPGGARAARHRDRALGFLVRCGGDLQSIVPENRALLARRDKLQAQIDARYRAGQPVDEGFLREIGYLVPEPAPFRIAPTKVDHEVARIARPQLVVPILNARFLLNAANARWGSLYDALYGSDVIPGDKGSGYDPVRGGKVIAWAKAFLDDALPLAEGSWADLAGAPVLADPSLYVGRSENGLLYRHNGLHIEVVIDRAHPIGRDDPAGIADVVLESAITTICDLENRSRRSTRRTRSRPMPTGSG